MRSIEQGRESDFIRTNHILSLARSGHPTAAGARRLDEVVRFHPALAHQLALADRVHTYAGFHIADVSP